MKINHLWLQTTLSIALVTINSYWLWAMSTTYTLNRTIGWGWDLTNFMGIQYVGIITLVLLNIFLWICYFTNFRISNSSTWLMLCATFMALISNVFQSPFELVSYVILFILTLLLLAKFVIVKIINI